MPARTDIEAGGHDSERITVSVVVPTRNRPDQVRPCVDSILANPELHELIVIDQSDGNETSEQLTTIADARFRYVRVESRGVSAARNRGAELATGSIIAATDDDCRVPDTWVESYIRVFREYPDASVVCGRVTVPEELLATGYAVSFSPQQREWRRRYPPPAEWGITANMATRREVLGEIGGLDPFLGSGGALRSGGEPDFLFRVLRRGLLVVNASEVDVTHLGIREFGPKTQALIRGYSFGISAAFLKHVRLGDLAAARIYLRFLLSMARTVTGNVLRGRRPSGAGVLVAFAKGARASLRFRVDRSTRMYVER